MMEGRIIRSISGFFDVRYQDNFGNAKELRCRAKGSFRKQGITPLVGDLVHFSNAGVVEEILPRKTVLIRPPVANVEQAVLVQAVSVPEPHFLWLERMLVSLAKSGVTPVIVFNKWDDAAHAAADVPERAEAYERAGFTLVRTSTVNGEGVDALKTLLKGKVSAFAGPSGVGKSSLLNLLVAGGSLETGSLSQKIQRGKNTTRVAELLPLAEGGYAADTPVFTSLQVPVTKPELADLYPDFKPYLGKCYFPGCTHTGEPGCAVTEALSQGLIEPWRYRGYRELFQEAAEPAIGEDDD